MDRSHVDPPVLRRFARLGSIQRQLADEMPAASEGMRRAVKCLQGSQMLSEDTIAAMLPEEVLRMMGRDGFSRFFLMGSKNQIGCKE